MAKVWTISSIWFCLAIAYIWWGVRLFLESDIIEKVFVAVCTIGTFVMAVWLIVEIVQLLIYRYRRKADE